MKQKNIVTLDKAKKCFWLHMDYKDNETRQILSEEYSLSADVVEALCEDETRPRYFRYKKGFVIILRAINHGSDSDAHDMASLRIWIDEKKIITIAHRKIQSLEKVKKNLKKNIRPTDCFLKIADAIANDIADVIYKIVDAADDLEEAVVGNTRGKNSDLRSQISNYRRKALAIRRYLVPHKDLYFNLRNENSDLITDNNKVTLREIYHQIIKSIEDLDYARDHLMVSFEELQGRTNVSISKIMYKIAIVTIIFLPMSLLTSLLGINVRGIPFAEEQHAFMFVVLGLLTVCTTLILILKKIKWL